MIILKYWSSFHSFLQMISWKLKLHEHNPESFLENAVNKIPWNFEKQTAQSIVTRKADLVSIKKKKTTCHVVDCAVPAQCKEKIIELEKQGKSWILQENWESYWKSWWCRYQL